MNELKHLRTEFTNLAKSYTEAMLSPKSKGKGDMK